MVSAPATGLLLPPGQTSRWAQALRQLQDPEPRQRMGQAARERVLQHYTWAENARKLVRHLQQAQG